MKSSKLLIEYQCPQCGAPATLEETDHLFSCDFCKVKSYLLSRVYRYVLPHNAGENRDLIFLPYWRFKGMLFSCVSEGIKHRIVDVSHQALQSKYFPATVGLRSQAMKLRFISSDMEGRFLQPDLPFKEMRKSVEKRYSQSLPKPIFLQRFIGDTLSLLYSPFYVDRKIHDAILNRPVSPLLPDDFNVADLKGGHPEWNLRFMPAQCPDCGWDLNGDRDSLALICRNCKTIWQAGKDKFMKLKFAHIPSKVRPVTYLPFWRIKAETTGIELDSYADLVKLANLPKVVHEDMKDQPFHFWSPAFKVRPQDFLRFSIHVTLTQPQGKWIPELPDSEPYPVTLPIMEAAESVKLNLASFMKPRRSLFPRLKDISIKPRSFTLIYIPFNEKGNELSYPDFRLRINRNLLIFARQL